jgi:hypothetical protein
LLKTLAMNRIDLVFIIFCFGLQGNLSAQSPEKFNYQAVARDASGNVLVSQAVSLRISILQGTLDGTAVYVETHATTTNAHGQLTVTIGGGTPVSGNFNTIGWGSQPHFMKTEMDAAGGTSYVLMGTTQLLSVPYALYAKEAGSGGTTYTAGTGIDITGTVVSNTQPNATHTGDATGSDALTVVKLQGRDLSATAPSSGQVIKWNGSAWAPANETDPALPSGTGYATLYHNGINWVTSSLLYNTNQRIGIGTSNPNQQLEITGNFRLPASSATVGNFYKGSNVFIHNKGTDNIYVGENSGNLNATAANNTALGAYSLYNVTSGHSQTAIGSSALRNTTSGQQNTAIGYWAMYSNTTGSFNTALGYRAISANTSGTENVALGYQTLMSNSTGTANTAVGYQALINNSTGYQNTGIGDWALKSNTTGYNNTAIGYYSMKSLSGGSENVGIGNLALNNTTTGIKNTVVGLSAGAANTLGSGNILIGYQAGDNVTSGNNNIVLGYDVDAPSATANNQMVLGNTATLYGDLENNRIGIGTTVPTQKLDIDGQIRIRGGDPGVGKVLISDADGAAIWDIIVASRWSANGNNISYNTGNVGIGVSDPSQKLDVDGQIRIRGGNPAINKVLTSDANGNGTWELPTVAPGTVTGQLLYWNDSVWVTLCPGSVGQVLSVDSSGIGAWQTPSVEPGTESGQMLYWDSTTWVTIPPGEEGQSLTVINGIPAWKSSSEPSSVTNPITGKTWLDRNLGASQVATSMDDNASFGDLYQWGRGADGHQKRNSQTTNELATYWQSGGYPCSFCGKFILDINNWIVENITGLWSGTSAENNPCPSGYRIPTNAEWEQERLTWSNNNNYGAYNSILKLPSAGRRRGFDGEILVGGEGYYWSSSGGSNVNKRRNLIFHNWISEMNEWNTSDGFSIRCIKD